jgi:hypothetical protein
MLKNINMLGPISGGMAEKSNSVCSAGKEKRALVRRKGLFTR